MGNHRADCRYEVCESDAPDSALNKIYMKETRNAVRLPGLPAIRLLFQPLADF